MKTNMHMNGRDHVEDIAVLCCSRNENRGSKGGNCLCLILLEMKPNMQMNTRKLSLIVGVKGTNSTRCPQSRKVVFQNYTYFTGGSVVPFSYDSTNIYSDTIERLYEKSTLLNIPAEVVNSGYMFRSLRLTGRTHQRIIYIGEFLAKCSLSSVTESGSLFLSPQARWILNCIEASWRRPLISRTLFSKPLMSDDRSTSSRTRNVKTSQLLTSSTRPSNLLTRNPELSVTRKMDSDAKISSELLLPFSSMKSTSSYCSTSSSGCFMTSATIRCFRNNNVPYFMFFSDDCHVYTASSIVVRSSTHKGLDYIYLFRSRNGNRKDSHDEIIGKMKVSSSLLLNTNRSKSMETEFVLCAAKDEFTREKQKSSNITETYRISKMVAERLSDKHKFGESGFPFEDGWQILAADSRVIENRGQADCLLNDFLPGHEMVAIVVKDQGYDRMNGAISGGWGLKFLEQLKVDSSNSPQNEGSSVQDFRSIYTEKCSSSKTVQVVIPTGFHGGSIGRTGGPSSLVERWMSNGHCDCGGWDIGCPLKVLINDCNSSNSSPGTSNSSLESVPEHGCKSLQLVAQGAKQREPTFKLSNLTEDMYAVYFQPTLLALQSFSIAVAIIHSQSPDLYPKL